MLYTTVLGLDLPVVRLPGLCPLLGIQSVAGTVHWGVCEMRDLKPSTGERAGIGKEQSAVGPLVNSIGTIYLAVMQGSNMETCTGQRHETAHPRSLDKGLGEEVG